MSASDYGPSFQEANCTNCLEKIGLKEYLDHDHTCEKCYYDFLDQVIYGNVTEPDPLD